MIKFSYILFAMIILSGGELFGQTSQPSSGYPIVRPDTQGLIWDNKAFFLAPAFWNNNKAALIKQVGEYEFEKIRKKSTDGVMPNGSRLKLYDPVRVQKKNSKTFKNKLNELIMYKIASFYDAESERPYAVLQISSNENKGWDTLSAPVWDTVYFVVEDKSLDERKLSKIKKGTSINWNQNNVSFLSSHRDMIVQQTGQTEFDKINYFFTASKNIWFQPLRKTKQPKGKKSVVNTSGLKGYIIATVLDDAGKKQSVFRISRKDNLDQNMLPADQAVYLIVPSNQIEIVLPK